MLAFAESTTIIVTMVSWWVSQHMNVMVWTVAQAKARFSELVDHARTQGPQTVTRHGRSSVVVVSVEEWEAKSRRVGNLAEFLATSPLAGSGLDVTRVADGPRELDV